MSTNTAERGDNSERTDNSENEDTSESADTSEKADTSESEDTSVLHLRTRKVLRMPTKSTRYMTL